MENENNETAKVVRLELTSDELQPALWVRLMDELREGGLEYGKKYETKWLAERLACDPKTIQFGAGISNINDELIASGYYLSARGQFGEHYVLVPPDQFESVADSRVRKSFRELKRSIVMFNGLMHNPDAGISIDDKRRLEAKAEKNGIRLALMRRPMLAAELKPKLIQQKSA